LALTEKDPHGNRSVTLLVLKFYNDVAKLVGRQLPDRVLCGYVYGEYLYPPKSGLPRMEPSVCLVLAPNIDYGYQLFRPEVQQDFKQLAAFWGNSVSIKGYYDLPSRLVDNLSATTPVATSILGLVYPTIADAGMKEVYMYGVADWGFGAATNYVEAKLNWDPYANPKILATQFFSRAYGKAAGEMMNDLNTRLEGSFAQFYREHPDARYSLTPSMLHGIYDSAYPDIERTYLKAIPVCETEQQRRRLELFGRGLMLFRWNLARLGLLRSSDSALARADDEMRVLLQQWATDLATSPEARTAALAILRSEKRYLWWIREGVPVRVRN
jgi:hypothetical protein